jgi:hypothetical protein
MRSDRTYVDVLERVFTKGVVFDVERGPGRSAAGPGSPEWFRLTTGGVHVFRLDEGMWWWYLFEGPRPAGRRQRVPSD